MKKMVFFLILIISFDLYSYEFYSFGEFSKDLSRVEYNIDSDLEWYNAVIGAGIQQQAGDWMNFFAEVELETYMTKISTASFSPDTQDYYVRGGVWAGPLLIQVQHVCFHVVDDFDSRDRGGHTRVTIGFDSRKK